MSEFLEADAALDRCDYLVAASIVDQLVDRRCENAKTAFPGAVGRSAAAPVERVSTIESLLRHGAVERLVAIDEFGRVQLYLRGSRSHIPLPTDGHGNLASDVLDHLNGVACIIHNHPTDRSRPIGGTMSLPDITLAQRFAIREVRVAAAEATYSLRPKSQMGWDATWIVPTQRAYRLAQASLNRAMSTALGSPTRDLYFYLRVLDFLILQLAKPLEMAYQRVDTPRSEWSQPIPSPQMVHDRPTKALIDDAEHFRWLSSWLKSASTPWPHRDSTRG